MPSLKLNVSSPPKRSHYFYSTERKGYMHPRMTWPRITLPYNRSGFSIPVTINPPPKAPRLDIILVLGPDQLATSIAHAFAEQVDNGYQHINLQKLLSQINALPDDSSEKKDALGLLHPSVLPKLVKSRHQPPSRLMTDILLRRINKLVQESNSRKFIITGFLLGSEPMVHFMDKVTMPNAVVFFTIPEDIQLSAEAANWMNNTFGEDRFLCVETIGLDPDGMQATYLKFLEALGKKALRQVKQPTPPTASQPPKENPMSRDEAAVAAANAILKATATKKQAPPSTQPQPDSDIMMLDDSDSSPEIIKEKIRPRGADTPMEEYANTAMDLLDGLEEYARDGEEGVSQEL